MRTAILTCFLAYVFLFVALSDQANMKNTVAILSFALTGALAGLFLRLFSEWKTNKLVTNDYALTRDRILVTPLLCSLAAIGGVLVASIFTLPFASLGTTGNPSTSSPQVIATVSVSGSTVQVTLVPQPVTQPQTDLLDRTFDLETNPGGLIWAAIFGLVPNLLINLLLQQAQTLQSQIQSAQPGSSGTDTSPSAN
jgi:hypothetical protein